MLTCLCGEPDLLLRVIRYLSLQAVARLEATARPLNASLVKHRREVRALLDINILLRIGGNLSINLFTDPKRFSLFEYRVGPGDTSTICFDIEKEPKETEKQGDLLYRLSDEISLRIGKNDSWREKAKVFSFTVHKNGNVASVLKPIFNYLLRGFRFEEFGVQWSGSIKGKEDDFFGPWSESFEHIEALVKWLVTERTSIANLVFWGGLPTTDQLVTTINELNCRRVKLSTGMPFATSLSSDFLQQVPRLKKLIADENVTFDINDQDLLKLDAISVVNQQAQITPNGLAAWVQMKLKNGDLADSFEAPCIFTFDDLLNELPDDNYCYEFEETSEFDEVLQGVYIRANTGRWLKLSTTEDGGYLKIEVVDSYRDRLDSTGHKFRSEHIFIMMMFNLGEHHEKLIFLSMKHIGRKQSVYFQHLISTFTVTNKLPEQRQVFLVDQWTDNISIYEDSFRSCIVHINKDKADEKLMGEIFSAFGCRLHNLFFDEIRCENMKTDAALVALLQLQQSTGVKIDCKILRLPWQTVPSKNALQRIVSAYTVRTLTRAPAAEDDDPDCPSWTLSAQFFETTPSLTSLELDISYRWSWPKIPHSLEITDVTLLRFTRIDAFAETKVTIEGLKAWIQQFIESNEWNSELYLLPPTTDKIDLKLLTYSSDKQLSVSDANSTTNRNSRDFKSGRQRKCQVDASMHGDLLHIMCKELPK